MQATTRTIALSGGMCATINVGTYGQTTILVHTPEGSRVFEGYSEAEALEEVRLAGFTVVADVSGEEAIEEIYRHILGLPELIEGEAFPGRPDADCVGTVTPAGFPAHVWPWPSSAARSGAQVSEERALPEWALVNNDFNPDFDPGFMGEHC